MHGRALSAPLMLWQRARRSIGRRRLKQNENQGRLAKMEFVQHELRRVSAKLQAGPLPTNERCQLYAVQQALAWALEPNSFKSPYETVTGTPASSEDYPAENG